MSAAFEAPKNAIYIILGEIQALTSSRKNNARWPTTHSYEVTPRLSFVFVTLVTPLRNLPRWILSRNSRRFSTPSRVNPWIAVRSFVRSSMSFVSVRLDLQDIDSNTFLTPFLDIIRSDETSGPITCLALNAVNKFLSYGLIGRWLDFCPFAHHRHLPSLIDLQILKVNLPHQPLTKWQMQWLTRDSWGPIPTMMKSFWWGSYK